MPGPRSAVLLAALLALSGAARAATPTLDQIVSLRRAGAPALSPDGRPVAYTVRDTDWAGNAFVTQVWVADARGDGTRQITRGPKSNTAPAWSPDGRTLAFLSERSDKPQIYLLDMRGGDAQALTTAKEGVLRFRWSPDGRQIA